MGHDVYICYDENDKDISDAICQTFEENNIKTWIKSRDMFSTDSVDRITNAIENSKHWGGYSPYKIYTVFNKNTGVYYAVTETGDICPMYTIEGEVMLVDQGNEYVVHKNLGEPDAQE